MQIKNLLEGQHPYRQKRIGAPEVAEGRAPAAKVDGSTSDTINLSEEALLRGRALKVATLDSGSRAEKIARLKQQVADGSYEPDLQKTAENLLRDELDLFI